MIVANAPVSACALPAAALFASMTCATTVTVSAIAAAVNLNSARFHRESGWYPPVPLVEAREIGARALSILRCSLNFWLVNMVLAPAGALGARVWVERVAGLVVRLVY